MQWVRRGRIGRGPRVASVHWAKKKREQLSTELPIDRYQLFAIIALLVLISEMLTSSGRKQLARASVNCIAIFSACSRLPQTRQRERAEEAMTKAIRLRCRFYAAEIDASEDKAIDPRLYLNAGLAHLEAGSLGKAEKTWNRRSTRRWTFLTFNPKR